MSLKGLKPLHFYPKSLKTIGDHIRKRRLDLNLLQKDTAARIGVDTTSIYNWEKNRSTPNFIHIPKIIQFLGYVPFECPQDTMGRLAYFKKVRGLNFVQLGKLVGIHHEQLYDWITGRKKPIRRSIEKIEKILEDDFIKNTYSLKK